MPHHARAAMWTVEGHWRWFTNCDQCGRWQIRGWYYEVYPPRERINDAEGGWWFACADCLVRTLTERIIKERAES